MTPSPATPPPAAGLAELVARTLRERIVEGHLRSGQPLREPTVASDLGASRNTVREAFRLLARDRLVVHEPNKGVTVRTLDEADVRDLYAVRLTLEPSGLPLVDDAAREELAEVVAGARRSAEQDDWPAVSTGDLRFHQLLVAAHGSPRLDEMFTSVVAELRLAFARVADVRRFHAPYLERNGVIVALLRDDDVEGAQRELVDYLGAARDELVAVVSRS